MELGYCDDEGLILAAKKELGAFGVLYDKHYDEVSRYVYHRTLDRAVTEELTSNTFYAAFCHIGRYKWKRIPFGAWLYRIAANEIRMHFRKNGRATFVSLESQSEKDLAATTKLASSLPDGSEMIVATEETAALHQAMRALSPSYQDVITLRYFEGMKVKEISQVVGKREGTVRSLIHRALQELRLEMSNRGFLED